MTRAYVVGLLVIALPCAAVAEPVTLKGLAPGMTKAQVAEAHPSITKSCMKPQDSVMTDEVCGYSNKHHSGAPALHTFAGVPVESWTVMLKEGIVHTVMIILPSEKFEDAETAVTERWGKPSHRGTSTVQNRMGATFDQVDARWLREGSVLRGMKRGGNVTKATFSLTTERGMEERYKAKKDAAKAAASDM